MEGEKFSGILQITGLDDFIGPGQTCIKPSLAPSSRLPAKVKGDEGSGLPPQQDHLKRARIELDDDGMGVVEIGASGEKNKLETAKITLNDCLACSGCITSAESVLITQQSKEEFYSNLAAVRQKKESEGMPPPFVLFMLSCQCFFPSGFILPLSLGCRPRTGSGHFHIPSDPGITGSILRPHCSADAASADHPLQGPRRRLCL